MTLTLLITINALAASTLVDGLAVTMSRAARLTPHLAQVPPAPQAIALELRAAGVRAERLAA